MFIAGDLNIDPVRDAHAHQVISETLLSYNIKRMTLPPTRITTNSAYSIDVVCSNINLNLINVQILHTGLSDHTGQLIKLNIQKEKLTNNYTTRRLTGKRNLIQLKHLLSQEHWEETAYIDQADAAYNHFSAKIGIILNNACPVKKRKIVNTKFSNNVKYSEEIKNLKKDFLQAQNQSIISGSAEYKALAAQKKKTYDLQLKKLRQEVNNKFISQSDNTAKAIWNVINTERKCNKETTKPKVELSIDGHKTADPKAVAEHFNYFFATIAEKTLQNQTRRDSSTENNTYLVQNTLVTFPPATECEIRKIIRSLKPKSSSGLDEITPKMIKFCEDELIKPLLVTINMSLKQGVFPKKLKIGKILPKHKQGDRTEAANYRPITLLSTFSKILEKVVLKRLQDHLKQNNLQTNKQHGFTSGKSTITAIAEYAEYIADNLEAGNTVVSIYLDLSKAFDCLGHDLIITNLRHLGIQGTALCWFRSYLSGRTQIVELRHARSGVTTETRSTPLPINRGVPQGSVLGPALFILLTNDLPKVMGAQIETIMYADDTVLLSANKDTNQLDQDINNALNMAQQYCESKDLVFNNNKTKQMSFGRGKNYVSEVPTLQSTDTVKHLGIHIDNKLSWNKHVDNLCLKLSSATYAIKRVRSVCNLEVARTAYFALFETQLRYALLVWGSSSLNNIQRVLGQQKRAVRTLAGLGPRESCRPAFKEHKILTIASLYILEVVMYWISKELPRNEHLHTYQTRHGINYNIPRHRTSAFEKKPSFAGGRLYNNLPRHLKSVPPSKLKTALKNWLLEQVFYNMNEFFSRNDHA